MPAKVDLEKMTMTSDELSVCVIGHVDAGKSSLCGRLLVETGAINTRQIDKLKKNAESMNASSFFLAHTMDTNPDEMKRGITITTNSKQFITPGKKRKITLVDAPGHRDFINNMITGAAQCNAAILVISGVPTEFRAGIATTGQTFEHTLLINALGVKNLIVAVNKQDNPQVNWSEDQYNDIVKEVKMQYKRLGGKESNIRFVPISGYADQNVARAKNDGWYKGKCLLDMIDEWPEVVHDLNTPLRMAVSSVCKIPGIGQVVTGKVYTGIMKVGDAVESLPSVPIKGVVKSMQKFHKEASEAYPDDSIGITLKLNNALPVKGDWIGGKNSGLEKTLRFEALVAVTGKDIKGVKVGFKPVIQCHVAKVASTLVEISSIKERKKGDKKDSEVIGERQTVQKGDKFVGQFQPDKGRLMIECDTKFGILTRFVIRNSNSTIGVGQCKKIVNDQFDADFEKKKKEVKVDDKKKK